MNETARNLPLTWLEAAPRLFGHHSLPCFDAVRAALHELEGDGWPSLDALNHVARQRGLNNFRHIPLSFIKPHADDSITQQYETRIAESGEILTRENWHDLFNALQWLTFPNAKAAISEMHTRLIAANDGETKARSIPRDVLTLFDEGGIIVASHDKTLLDLIRNFQWRTLFVERREEVKTHMHFYLAGHSVLKKMLNPFIGITAKALLIAMPDEMPQEFDNALSAAPVLAFDDITAAWLLNETNLSNTRHLHPLPILGIPGWDARNESPGFYDDTHYFRSGRTKEY